MQVARAVGPSTEMTFTQFTFAASGRVRIELWNREAACPPAGDRGRSRAKRGRQRADPAGLADRSGDAKCGSNVGSGFGLAEKSRRSVILGCPVTLSWIGSAGGCQAITLCVDHFGLTGADADLHRDHGIGAEYIVRKSMSGQRASRPRRVRQPLVRAARTRRDPWTGLSCVPT